MIIVPTYAQTNVQLYRQLGDLHWSESDLARVRDAYELAFELFSGKYRRSHRPFISHVVGTASIIAEVDGRREMVLAALLHAAYSVGDWGRPAGRGADARMRAEVRGVVGADAEELIWRYPRFPRTLESLRSWTETAVDCSSPALARDLVVLRLVNQVEELQDYSTAENALDLVGALAESATTLGAEQLADRLIDIAATTDAMDVPGVLRRPRHPRNVVPPRSYRLASRVKAREQLRRLVPRPIRSRIRRRIERRALSRTPAVVDSPRSDPIPD